MRLSVEPSSSWMARASLRKHPWSPVDWTTSAGAVIRPRWGVARHCDSARLHMSSHVRSEHADASPKAPRLAVAGSPA